MRCINIIFLYRFSEKYVGFAKGYVWGEVLADAVWGFAYFAFA